MNKGRKRYSVFSPKSRSKEGGGSYNFSMRSKLDILMTTSKKTKLGKGGGGGGAPWYPPLGETLRMSHPKTSQL